MPTIKVLPKEIFNMIAAGEVIERPASVVKELVENSLDAGAKNIIVKIQEAGRNLIRVSDDGKGMDEEDLSLAFLAHATSKISSQKDLFRISSLGFRGEALPSIASVSEVKISSSTKDMDMGNYLEIDAGKIIKNGKCSPIEGCIVDVKNLFYNTPARLKHLKSNYTEIAKVNEVVSKLALAHKDVSFSLYVDDKLSFYTSGKDNMKEIIASLYGLDIARDMKEFSISNNEFKIEGYTSSIGVSKSSKNFITTILNGRPIKMFSLQKALIEAYKPYLFGDRYPISVISIEVDPNLVDVNVHPSKDEVRMSKENELNDLLIVGIENIFKTKEISPQVVNKIMSPKVEQKTIDFEFTFKENIEEVIENSFENEFINEEIKKYEEVKEEDNSYKVSLVPIGQFAAKYILAFKEDILYIIDQHAAAERINYEKFNAKYNDRDSWTYTDLLIPLIINFSNSETIKLMEYIDFIKEIGILITPFGQNSFKVTSIPTWMSESDPSSYIEEILNYILDHGKKVKMQEVRREVIATISCKASLRANHVLSYLEMNKLLIDLFKCENPFTCPHGRPTMIRYSLSELDKMFKRS